MGTRFAWVARMWHLYLFAGILWVALGALVLGARQGQGLIFIGLDCLGLAAYGAAWRLSHGQGLIRIADRQASNRR